MEVNFTPGASIFRVNLGFFYVADRNENIAKAGPARKWHTRDIGRLVCTENFIRIDLLKERLIYN
jgi:hypothetical protein